MRWGSVAAVCAVIGGCQEQLDLGGSVDPQRSTVVVDRATGLAADGVDRAHVTITLVTASGMPIPGQAVELTASGAANLIVGPGALTGSDGVATATIGSSAAGTKTLIATANPATEPVELAARPTVTFDSAAGGAGGGGGGSAAGGGGLAGGAGGTDAGGCAAATSNTFYVDSVNGDDVNGTGSDTPGCAFRTVTRAFAFVGATAVRGTTVLVRGPATIGSQEMFPLDVPENVLLAGTGGTVTVEPSPAANAIGLHAPGSGISDLTVHATGPGTLVGVLADSASDITTTIERVSVVGFASGIVARGSTVSLSLGEGLDVRGASGCGLSVQGASVTIVVSASQLPSIFTFNGTGICSGAGDRSQLLIAGDPDAGSVSASGNKAHGLELGPSTRQSVIIGLVTNTTFDPQRIQPDVSHGMVLSGAYVKLRHSVSLGNDGHGLYVTDNLDGGVDRIDLGTSADYGRNTLQASGPTANSFSGICFDAPQLEQHLIAEGNVFANAACYNGAGPLDYRWNACVNHGDIGVVNPTDALVNDVDFAVCSLACTPAALDAGTFDAGTSLPLTCSGWAGCNGYANGVDPCNPGSCTSGAQCGHASGFVTDGRPCDDGNAFTYVGNRTCVSDSDCPGGGILGYCVGGDSDGLLCYNDDACSPNIASPCRPTCMASTNAGAPCNVKADCPSGTCSGPKVCNAGANAGAACTSASDCDPARPDYGGLGISGCNRFCVGGSSDGRPCLGASDCGAGGMCGAMKQCNGGLRDRQACALPSDCPAATCVRWSCDPNHARCTAQDSLPSCESLDTHECNQAPYRKHCALDPNFEHPWGGDDAGNGVGCTASGSAEGLTVRSLAGAVAAAGHLYVIGGDGNDSTPQSVVVAPIGVDGTVGPWSGTTRLSASRFGFAAATYNGFVYIAGGNVGAGAPQSASVEFAQIQADGTLSAWTATTALPTARSGLTVEAWGGHLYALGGGLANMRFNDVFVAAINPDGTLGPWAATSSFTTPRYEHASVVTNGYLYVTGGSNTGRLTDTQFAPVLADGGVGAWSPTNSFTGPRAYHSAVAAGGHLYVLGGLGLPTGLVQGAPINSNGTLGTWTFTTPFPIARYNHRSVASNGYVYVITGASSADSFTDLADIQVAHVTDSPGVLSPWSTTGATNVDSCNDGVRNYGPCVMYATCEPITRSCRDVTVPCAGGAAGVGTVCNNVCRGGVCSSDSVCR